MTYDPVTRKVAADLGKTPAEIDAQFKRTLWLRLLRWWAVKMNTLAGSKRWE